MQTYQIIKDKIKKAFVARQYFHLFEYCAIALDYLNQHQKNFLPKITKFYPKPNTIKTNLAQSPQNSEYQEIQLYAMLADIAIDYEDDARALFEYYQTLKAKKTKYAEGRLLALIHNFDAGLNQLSLAMKDLHELNIDTTDGILFDDFQKVVKEIGFKEAFEDLMFSSKVVITNKQDFLSFMQGLVQYGYDEIALNYFENAGLFIFYDKDFANLYKKILKNHS